MTALSQHDRLIRIDTPLGEEVLTVLSFTGQETLSALFRFEVDCLSACVHLTLTALIGQEVTLRLLLANGGHRVFHAMVVSVQELGSMGVVTRYRVHLAPWMHAMTLRRDSYVFQDRTVPEIVAEICRDYPAARWRFDIRTTLPQRSLAIQYRETDYAFITRLLAEEGLNFFFEHDDNQDEGSSTGMPIARHTLVVFDDNAALTAGQQSSIRFHRAAATETSDTITSFMSQHSVQANAVTLTSWDYRALTATTAENLLPTGNVMPALETYEGTGAYRYTDRQEAARIAGIRAESLAMSSHEMRAESSVRALAVGTWFVLTDYPGHLGDTRADYVVCSIEHRGANNLPTSHHVIPGQSNTAPGTYRNRFSCIPRTVPVRPTYWFPKPVAPGVQVALVVGIPHEEITTERDHRIKVQFPWQRGERAILGQLAHPATSNAPADASAGTWVRVAEPVAGANWGAHFLPRIGQEVLVEFIAGDIDRPVVTGQIYNGNDAPHFHGDDNHRGALAGIRSREYGGNESNQWTMDDTPEQLRQSLATSYAAANLHIGYLIQQQGNTRGIYRGLGFELASDAWGVARAGRGLFLSTSRRQGAVSTQLDTQEAQDTLRKGAALAHTLSAAASGHGSEGLTTPDSIAQAVTKMTGSDTSGNQTAPCFGQELALIDSAAGIGATTSASSVAFAEHDLTVTTSGSVRVTAGEAVTLAAAESVSLFTDAGGAKIVTSAAPLSIQAHTGAIAMTADQAMSITSSNAGVVIQTKETILLASGGGYVRLAGANIDLHCPATVSVRGMAHDFMGPGSGTLSLPVLPDR